MTWFGAEYCAISNWLELETGLEFIRNDSVQCNIFSEGSSRPSEAFQSSTPSSLIRFIGDSVVTSRGCGSLERKVICYQQKFSMVRNVFLESDLL